MCIRPGTQVPQAHISNPTMVAERQRNRVFRTRFQVVPCILGIFCLEQSFTDGQICQVMRRPIL